MEQKYIDNFIKKISPEPMTGCWLWTGACDAYGYVAYGIAKGNKKANVYKAHRFSAWIHDKIPDYKMSKNTPVLRHTCNQRCCVNPSHLEPGSYQDNTNDMIQAGRSNYVGRPKRKYRS